MEFDVNNLLETFLNNTFQESIPWLIVMAAVIFLDLIVGVKRAYFVGEDVKLSTAVRRTMTKTIGYFWFVVTVSFINVAASINFDITTWACLIVCSIELSSTISNFLKLKGYKFNKEKGVEFLLRKTMKRLGVDSIEKGELTGLIEKEETIKTEEKKEDSK